jgi:hypothetical protein
LLKNAHKAGLLDIKVGHKNQNTVTKLLTTILKILVKPIAAAKPEFFVSKLALKSNIIEYPSQT